MEILTYINALPIYCNKVPKLPYDPNLKSRAQGLRKAGNFSEVIFWQQVHKRKFHGIDFHRQRVIGNYIVDFYVVALALAIEIDGVSHNEKEAYDMARDKFLESFCIKIWRVSDLRVKCDLENVMRELEGYIVREYGK